MHFVQKIYSNNKPLILTNDSALYKEQHPVATGYLSFTGAFPRNYRLAMEHLEKITSLGAIIEDLNTASLQQELYNIYTPVDAGGGVVLNENDNVLMIFRRGKWDLPKGKRDEGEEIGECALREVAEETGLANVKLGKKICDTFHIYSQNQHNLLKCTSWYKMKASSTETLIPQKEENILEARWLTPGDLTSISHKSYEAIREVLHLAGFKW